MTRYLFSLALFLSAALLFSIQPLVAKVLLPVYGGTPAVWTVCMLFFQLLLLVAYAYAWLLSRLGRGALWRFVHMGLCLLSLCLLPLVFKPVSGLGFPEFQILSSLLSQLGLPLLVIGVSAPLLQYAYSQTNASGAQDPYFLYAASNAGSLIALLSYPFVIERFVGIQQQFYGWNALYVAYLLLLFCLLFVVPHGSQSDARLIPQRTTWRQRGQWVFLSLVPCSLMLGVTFYMSTDIAATPLLWVLPLALYLLSFIVTFASKPLISHAWITRYALFFWVCPILGFIIGFHEWPVQYLIMIHLVVFFILALLCHGELVRIRPPAQQLTTFYLCMSLGGVLAGLFNGLVAPRLFSQAYEYPLMLFLVLFCFPKQILKKLRLLIGLSLLGLYLSMLCFKPSVVLNQQRNFYGIKQVFSQLGAHVLMSQSTMHGFQMMGEQATIDGARAYYGPVLPVVQGLQSERPSLRAMVLGLGTGILACQFRSDDQLTMVEVDEQVIHIASNPDLFTYLRDCPPKTQLMKEDGLLAVTKADDASYDLLVMDAFNSDAVPIHLLTLEAFARYQKKITEQGAVLVNITNRHLALLPVLNGAGHALDMIVLYSAQPANHRLGQFASEWALLTSNVNLASRLMGKQGWRFVTDGPVQVWTNDYSNIIPLLKW